MAIKKSYKIKLDKKDYLRALLTDTAPNDVPLVFSNEGLYVNSHRANNQSSELLNKIIFALYSNHIDPSKNNYLNISDRMSAKNKYSSPFKYKIIKNEHKLRTLSLTHPRTQLNFTEFYRDHSPEINYLCGHSQFSIRAPVKVGNSFTLKSQRKITSEDYKNIDIDTLESELHKKSSSSFFTYKGHTRLYKIYTSERLIGLEKKFNHMWLLDISNCFDSIYTHSISWAVKDKSFIKEHVKFSNQFCQKLDTLMQRGNNNETNGISIGSEFSRVFAEIIFQKIDVNIENYLDDKFGLKHSVDYEVIRYVDDYMIFSTSEKSANIVYKAIEDALNDYNLYLSEAKTHKYSRPFCTEKSSLIVGLNVILNDLEHSLFDVHYFNKNKQIFPKKIYRKLRFKNNFIDKVKRLCVNNKSDYSLPSNFLISVFNRRINELTLNYYDFKKEYEKQDLAEGKVIKEERDRANLIFRDALEILLNLILFFYSVKPSLGASNKVAQSIIKVDRFISEELPHFTPYIRTFIMDCISNDLYFSHEDSYREGFTYIEQLNILLATAEFDENYLISPSLIKQMLNKNEEPSYFEIISLLYYCKDHEKYLEIISLLEVASIKKLDTAMFAVDSEALHLLLDLLSCPYVSSSFKRKILKAEIERNQALNEVYIDNTNENLDNILRELKNTYWFVKWTNSDLYELLVRKELNPVY